MSQISVFDMTGKKVADTELNDAIFGIEPNKAIMHAMVVNYLANQRQGTQSTLTRTEVRGGGRKPWRQKGTGHARQGSIRAPQWVHGGVALGPKPRDYSYSLNKKERRLGMKSALSTKVVDENLVVVQSSSRATRQRQLLRCSRHLVLRVRLSSLQQSLTRLLSRVQPTFLALRQLL